MFLDLFFTYKYSLRFLSINKFGFFFNTYNIPFINRIFLCFFLKRLEDIDEVQIYNNFYLFKFFFGTKAFYSKTKKFFSLGVWYYNFNVQLILNNQKDIYFLLYFFFNNIIVNVEKNLCSFGLLNKKLNIFYFILRDINIYSELKTNMGLFNIKVPLNVNLYLSGCDYNSSKLFLNILKINI